MWLLISLLVFIVSPSKSLYAPGGDVAELVPSNFDRLVLQSDSIWVVEFFAPWCGHCQQLVPDYQKAAKALKGIVKFGAVNADEHRSLGAQYGIQGFPTIKIFTGTKNSPIDFNGQRTAQGITEAAIQEIKKKVKASLSGSGDSGGGEDEVIQLTDSNFDKLVLGSDDVWLVEFFAPWCGHCKNLAPHWAAAASELKGKVKLGALDATVNTAKAQEYEVKGYPTIKFFHAGKKSRSDAVDYDGGRTSSDIIAWALEKHADSIVAPEIKEITDESVLKTACQVKPLCVVAILPHILDCDSKCRNSYLDILKEMAEKYKKKEWGWVWAEGAAQNHLEESLELGGFGYPAMAVANLKKMKFSVLKGSFSRDGINEFLRDISYGRGQTAPVKGASLPKIYKTEPWDGKDGQLPELDDVDLSDIDLDEKDEL